MLRMDSTFVCVKSLHEHRSQNPSRIRELSLGEEAVLYAQTRTQVAELADKGEQRLRPLSI
jgi:hypothetical protein